MPQVTAVIPTWNRRDLLVRLLDRLNQQSLAPGEVIVVDNGSQDGSSEAAEAAGARVIGLEVNRGFAAAVNRGVAVCKTELLAVLNNDVEPAPDWLERLVSGLAPDAWFATGKLLDWKRRDILDGAYDLISRGGAAWRAGHGWPDSEDWNEPKRISLAPFTAVLMRRALFDRIGLLEEQFESYLEDVDFGLRAARAGCQGVYVPSAVAWHMGSATLGPWHPDTTRRRARNQVFLIARHYPDDWPLRYGRAVLAGQVLGGLAAARHGAGLAYLRGQCEAIRRWEELRAGRPGAAGCDIGPVLEESERQIRHLVRRHGAGPYWKLYFALAGEPRPARRLP